MTDQSAFVSDPWAAAVNPEEATYSSDVYGQMEMDVWFCVLQKGVGRVPFDPTVHTAGQRRTVVDVVITDISGYNYSRSFIAEIATDGWLKITLPSLQALGVTDLKGFNGTYVHAVMEAHGEYTDRDGNKKQRTAPKILRTFPNLEACEAAAQGDQKVFATATATAAPPVNGNGHAPAGDDAERQVALQFLPAIVKTCVEGNGVNSAKLDLALKSNPILARHFNLASPEVAQAMSQALAEPAF
jgi:hypothetical protein